MTDRIGNNARNFEHLPRAQVSTPREEKDTYDNRNRPKLSQKSTPNTPPSKKGTPASKHNTPSNSSHAAATTGLENLPPPMPIFSASRTAKSSVRAIGDLSQEGQRRIKGVVREAEDLPTIGDKIGRNPLLLYERQLATEGQRNIVIRQPMGNSENSMVMMILTAAGDKREVMGGVCCTPKSEGFELEYGKSLSHETSGFGKLAVNTLLQEVSGSDQWARDLNVSPAQIYAEVSSQDDELNMPSYLTLLNTGFIPVKRSTGDYIRWVHPANSIDSDSIHHEILAAHHANNRADLIKAITRVVFRREAKDNML
jgi:hypothetical protein